MLLLLLLGLDHCFCSRRVSTARRMAIRSEAKKTPTMGPEVRGEEEGETSILRATAAHVNDAPQLLKAVSAPK